MLSNKEVGVTLCGENMKLTTSHMSMNNYNLTLLRNFKIINSSPINKDLYLEIQNKLTLKWENNKCCVKYITNILNNQKNAVQ